MDFTKSRGSILKLVLGIVVILLCLAAVCDAAKQKHHIHKIPILTESLGGKHKKYRPVFRMYGGKICTFWDFTTLREIGGNSLNAICLARHTSGELVVVKKFHRDARHEGIRMEEVVLNMLHHPGLPTGICTFKHAKDATSVVMKYIEGMGMADWLKTSESAIEDNLRIVIVQLVDVLLFLHDHTIIHNNVALENIIIGKDLQVKLIGFEFTRHAPNGLNLRLGNPYNMAPEKLAGATFHNGVDWYGLGLVLFQATKGYHPFTKAGTIEELVRIVNHGLPAMGKSDVNDLILNLCNPDSTGRWSHSNGDVWRIKSHIYLQTPTNMKCKMGILVAAALLSALASRLPNTNDAELPIVTIDARNSELPVVSFDAKNPELSIVSIDIRDAEFSMPAVKVPYEHMTLLTLLNIPTSKFVAPNGNYNPIFPNHNGQPCRAADFTILECIGRGRTSVVYLASHVKGRVVIKTFNKMNLGVLYDIGHLRMEEAILHKSDHPNIPKGICTYIHEGNAMMAMEFTADTTLADWLNTTWFQDVNNQRFFARQMISVLKYLHGLDILHNDIKPANIIMAKDGTIKLIDYGLARYAPGGMVGVLGTTVFMSPEKLHISHFNNGSDWYSFGLILYMMIAGKHPFSDVATRKELLIAVKGSLKPLPFPVANQFVGMFLHPDPIKRWCFANSNLDEMEHHYFWGLTKSAL